MNKEGIIEIKDNIFKKCTYGVYVISCGNYGCVIDTFMQITSSKEDHTKALMIINKKSDTANKIKEERYCLIQFPSTKTNIESLKTLGYTHSSVVKPFNKNNSVQDIDGEYILNNVCGVLSAKVDKVYTVKDRYVFILDVDNFDNLPCNLLLKPLTYEGFKKKANKKSIFKKKSK